MVALKTVRSEVSSFVGSRPIVAAFFGGTSGIAEYTLRVLAKTHATSNQELRVYVVGRNLKAAQSIIDDCARACPDGKFIFVQAADLSLLKDVDRVCSEIVQREEEETKGQQEPRLDLLVMSQACTVFQKRKDTTEGLDFLMSLMYYSRMRCIDQLLPLLTASKLPASVVSIYAAGTEDKLFLDDLSLRDPSRYGYFQARSHVAYMTTAFMETIAERCRGNIRLSHVFPGLVMTPAFNDPSLPIWFRLVKSLLAPIMRSYSVPPEDVGFRMLYLATPHFPAKASVDQTFISTGDQATEVNIGTDGSTGSGAYAVGQDSAIIPPPKAYQGINKADLRTQVWTHTTKAFDDILAGKQFSG